MLSENSLGSVIGQFDEQDTFIVKYIDAISLPKEWADSYEILQTYDMYILNGQNVKELDQTVEVRLTCEKNWKDRNLKVIHIKSDQTVEDLPAVMREDSLSFQTTHFSTFAVVAEKAEAGSPVGTGDGHDLRWLCIAMGSVMLLGMCMCAYKFQKGSSL